MKQLTIVLFISALATLLLTGCQESDSSQIRRARLIATENMQLKQDLEDRDQQIEELKAQIEALELQALKHFVCFWSPKNERKQLSLRTGSSKKSLED
ncbi:MAG: hypothetical protein ACYSQY_15040 [Planctomycetota bacterium]|jgi:outer membrane murein-binding lipoprotein Lpp